MNINKLNTLMKTTAKKIDSLEMLVAQKEAELMKEYERYEYLRKEKNFFTKLKEANNGKEKTRSRKNRINRSH